MDRPWIRQRRIAIRSTRRDHVMVPPEKTAYRLRRVWLSEEEEAGYYFGFANEGLWPLCHIAHTPGPVFRAADWAHYRKVNRQFAEAKCEEVDTEDPDRARARLPLRARRRLIRDRLPRATVITFWHIRGPIRRFSACARGAGDPRRHARDHHPRLPHPVSLQQLYRYGRPVSRGAHRPRAQRSSFSPAASTEVRAYPISIEWPLHGLKDHRRRLPTASGCTWRAWAAPDVLLGIGGGLGLARPEDLLEATPGAGLGRKRCPNGSAGGWLKKYGHACSPWRQRWTGSTTPKGSLEERLLAARAVARAATGAGWTLCVRADCGADALGDRALPSTQRKRVTKRPARINGRFGR